MQEQYITKYISMISRSGSRFFGSALAPYTIGSGQYYFLTAIRDHEGISMYDLSQHSHCDKATVTRAVQKLGEAGYITCQMDERDRRIRHLYTTEAAKPLLEHIQNLSRQWAGILAENLSPEEVALADALLEKIAHNAIHYKKEGNSVNE